MRRPGHTPARTRGAVSFENVRFGYGRPTAALDGFTLNVRPGERVALVGRSGAGKTTAVSLLLRLYEVEGGRILLSSTGERPTPCRPGTASLHVVTADPDSVLARATALEARVVHEIVDQTDYPSRDFTVADPDGNHWTFATFAG